jgi:hypothetical protein
MMEAKAAHGQLLREMWHDLAIARAATPAAQRRACDMPSIDERNAAFDAVKAEIVALEQRLPGMFVGYVEKYIGTDTILGMVDAALGAAERVRREAELPSPPHPAS